jgi:hypothetical protein
MNEISISFANGGHIMTVGTDNGVETTVFNSTPKLVKALREAIDELSLLPKKADKDEGADAA